MREGDHEQPRHSSVVAPDAHARFDQLIEEARGNPLIGSALGEITRRIRDGSWIEDSEPVYTSEHPDALRTLAELQNEPVDGIHFERDDGFFGPGFHILLYTPLTIVGCLGARIEPESYTMDAEIVTGETMGGGQLFRKVGIPMKISRVGFAGDSYFIECLQLDNASKVSFFARGVDFTSREKIRRQMRQSSGKETSNAS